MESHAKNMPQDNVVGLSANDPNSFSEPSDCVVTDINLKLEVNFDKQVLSGNVVLTIERKLSTATTLILDTKDLNISAVSDNETGESLAFHLGAAVKTFGNPLQITLPTTPSPRIDVMIKYETTPSSSALQWLKPNQTAGKIKPFLFSQCQAIHCRAMIPCQDTPTVKAKYTAEIVAPKDLTVLMSAVRVDSPLPVDGNKLLHKFHQKIPVPAYLIAMAVGALESRRIGPRSHVWSEKELIDLAAYEFGETEQMLHAAESVCGEYVWGIYDILVLPPSFPFGGMENPCLTFVTPTLLAGDRSLADVIAHEISHSWTGNLVTNRNFEHFWLNEGFTVFVERKIFAQLKGEVERHFMAIGGWNELSDCIKYRGSDDPLTCLVPNLKGTDPDDAFCTVPYEKGHTFLFYLEELVGGPKEFDPFLRDYINEFKYKSIDSFVFKEYFLSYFKHKSADLQKIDWNAWFFTPGMPPVQPKYDNSLAQACMALAKRWIEWDVSTPCTFYKNDLDSMSAQQVREFLAELLECNEPIPVAKLTVMEELYSLNKINNCEIKMRWLRLGIRAHWVQQVDNALEFVASIGRMKFVRPIYKDLYKWEEMREKAVKWFLEHKESMMHVTAYTVSQDLHLLQN